MNHWGTENNPNNWSNVGGCWAKHPFSAEKRAQCEQTYASTNPKALQAAADAALAQAAAEKARSGGEAGWTPTQTAAVAIGSLLAIGLVAILIVKAKQKKAQ